MKTYKIENILIHLFSWICGVIIPVLYINPSEISLVYFEKWTFDVGFAAIYFYFNIYWIVPELANKNKTIKYLFVTVFSGLIIILQQYLIERSFDKMIFDSAKVSALIMGRALITFIWVFVVSNRLAYMEYMKQREKESITEISI